MNRSAAFLVALCLASVARAQNVEWSPQTVVVLKGTVVTMDGTAEPKPGLVVVQNGKVKAVLPANAAIPAGAAVVDTKGFIYPGLMNMHDHIAYNYLKLYDLPKHYKNHDEWPNGPDYAREVNNPNVVVKKLADRVAEAQKYAEIRAILGGTTSIQGADTKGGRENGTTLVRNVEMKNFGQDLVGQNALGFDHRTHIAIRDRERDAAELKRINDALANNPTPGERTALLRQREELEKKMAFNPLPSLGRVKAFLLHLAEGIDEVARREFIDERYDPSKPIVATAANRNVPGALQSGMVVPSLVGIHCTALKPQDFQAWRETLIAQGANPNTAAGRPKVIWSPVSNLLLYGKTTDIAAAKKANALVALGTDWAPSGTKNLLWELKAVESVNQQSNPRIFASDREIVELVTVNAAQMIGWEDKVGRIVPNLFADLLVVDAVPGARNAYHNLILAREEHVQLVFVDGNPLAGDEALLRRFKTYAGKFRGEVIPGSPAGRSKAVDLLQDPSVSTLTLAQVTERLQDALSLDPAKLAERINTQDTTLRSVNDHLTKLDRKANANAPARAADRQLTPEDVARYMKDKYPSVRPISQLESFFTDEEFFADIEGNVHWKAPYNVNLNLRPYFGPTAGMTSSVEDNN